MAKLFLMELILLSCCVPLISCNRDTKPIIFGDSRQDTVSESETESFQMPPRTGECYPESLTISSPEILAAVQNETCIDGDLQIDVVGVGVVGVGVVGVGVVGVGVVGVGVVGVGVVGVNEVRMPNL